MSCYYLYWHKSGYIFHHYCFLLFLSVFFSRNTKLYILYECQLCLIFITVRKLTECENFQNSDCPFRFLFKDFLLCSRYSKVSYSAKHVCKPLFGSSATIFRLTFSELSLSINVKKLKRSPGNCRTKYKLADGVTALAQLRVLYSDRARSFNRWQPTLHPKCTIIHVDCKLSTNQSFHSV